jgi:hypothetical protein
MWARILNAALGIWLMAAPAVLGYSAPAETNDRILGPVIATFAIVAISGATRPVRRVNTVAGGWLLLAPWVLGYGAGAATVNDMLVGAVVVGASLVKGKVTDRFGGGWSALWRSGELHRPGEAAG